MVPIKFIRRGRTTIEIKAELASRGFVEGVDFEEGPPAWVSATHVTLSFINKDRGCHAILAMGG